MVDTQQIFEKLMRLSLCLQSLYNLVTETVEKIMENKKIKRDVKKYTLQAVEFHRPRFKFYY